MDCTCFYRYIVCLRRGWTTWENDLEAKPFVGRCVVENNGTMIYREKIRGFWIILGECFFWHLFPTCQVRVVRFYQSCSSPPRLALLLFLLLFLFLASPSSSSSFSSSMSASTSTSTSALPTLRQALCQLSSPSSLPTSQLSVHRWTSTWDLPSSVRTAGPQPGTFPAQCALLDLNLGPSQLSVHRWTSTWDLPSSVCTAGPQPGTFPAQCAPLDLNLGPAQLSVYRWTSTAR